MAVGVVVGVRRWKPAQPMAWYMIAAGQLLFSIGDAVNHYREWVLKTEVPVPSVGDPFYLVFYPLLAAGLLLVRGRAPGRDAASLIDATIITTGIGMLSWVFLIGPYVRLPDLSLDQRLVSIAYPLGDLLLLAVAVRLWRAGQASAWSTATGRSAARSTPPGSCTTSPWGWPHCTRRWCRCPSRLRSTPA